MLQFLYVEKGLSSIDCQIMCTGTGECLDVATFFTVARFLQVVRARGGGGGGNR